MKRVFLIILALSFAFVFPASATAGSIGLEAYLKLVREHSPQLARERAELEVVRTELLEAKMLPNPSLAFQTGQRAAGANTLDGAEYEIMLEQPFLLFGQRSARKKVAELAIESAEIELEAAFLEVAAEAHIAFAELLMAQQKNELFEDAFRNIEETREVVKALVEEGAQSPYHLLRLDMETAELIAEYHTFLAELRQAQSDVSRFISKPDERHKKPWVAQGSLEPSTSARPQDSDWQEVRAKHPLLRAASRAQQAADATIDLAKSERWPELDVGVGAKFTTDESSVNIIAGVGFELPVFDRGQASIARAQAEAFAAKRAQQLREAELRAEFELAVEQMVAQEKALQAFREGTKDDYFRLREMTEDSYSAGQIDILELLDALQTINTLQGIELDLLAALYKARIDLDAAAGRVP